MPKFWLDTDTLIQAKNGPYAFDIAAGFWTSLEEKASQGLVCSAMKVFDELLAGNDELEEWARRMERSGFFVDADDSVQAEFTQIADYVVAEYETHHAEHFLRGADPWLIAHTKSEGAIVVTHEKSLTPNARKVKIPNVCNHFGVEFVQLWELLRRLKIKLIV